MKTLKKFLRGILTCLLIICIGLLFLSLHLKGMVNELIKEAMKAEISSPITSLLKKQQIIEHNDKSEQITDILLNNEEINKLYDQYSTTIMNAMMDEKELDHLDLSHDIQELLKKNQTTIQKQLGIKITDKQIEQFSSEIANSDIIKEHLKNTVQDTKQQLSPQEQTLLQTYVYIISEKFQFILQLFIGSIIVLIAILYPSIYRPLFNVGMATTMTSIFNFIMIPIFKSIIDYYFEEQLNILKEVNINHAITDTAWMLGLGIFLLLLYYIINYFIHKKKDHETN